MKRKVGPHSKDVAKPAKMVKINQISNPTRWSVTNHESVIATRYLNSVNSPCAREIAFHSHLSTGNQYSAVYCKFK